MIQMEGRIALKRMWCASVLFLACTVAAVAQQASPPPATTQDTATQQAQPAQPAQPAQQQATHPAAFSYPPGYDTRLKIHKYASYATLPLFAGEVVLGNKLYSNPNQPGIKSAHGAVATGIVGLFAVNSVTGIWNMWDARKDPQDHAIRTLHGFSMLVADAGIAVTAMLTPHAPRGVESANFDTQRATHRDWAYGSIGVATFGYALMLFHHR